MKRRVCIPFELLEDPEMDAVAIATYAALASYCDLTSEGEVSDRNAARRAGCSRRTFQTRRDWLRENGWIEWESGKGVGRPNRYIVHPGPPGSGARREADVMRRVNAELDAPRGAV